MDEFKNAVQKKVSPRTTKKILRVLKMIFGYAEQRRYININDNPARLVDNVRQAKNERDSLGRLGSDEIDRFLKEADPEYYPLFVTAIWTGMREEDLVGEAGFEPA